MGVTKVAEIFLHGLTLIEYFTDSDPMGGDAGFATLKIRLFSFYMIFLFLIFTFFLWINFDRVIERTGEKLAYERGVSTHGVMYKYSSNTKILC